MERNPYAPPKADLDDANADASSAPRQLYTPVQHTVAAFVGSPIAAALIAALNYRALGRRHDARRIIGWGMAATAAVFVIAVMLPEEFPNVVLPVAYCVVVRSLAQSRFGALVDAHRAAGGKLGSWWLVVGMGLLSLTIVGLGFFGLAVLLFDLGVVE
jgi:hypothetical protein